jgi:hypothetical protein
MCGMFVWNSEKSECLLHSNSTFFGNVSIETGFLIYSRMYSGMYSDSKAGLYKLFSILKRDSYGRDRMVIRFTTTRAFSAYYN